MKRPIPSTLHGTDVPTADRVSGARMRAAVPSQRFGSRRPLVEIAADESLATLVQHFDRERVQVRWAMAQEAPDTTGLSVVRDVLVVPAAWLDTGHEPPTSQAAMLGLPTRQIIAVGPTRGPSALESDRSTIIHLGGDLPAEALARSITRTAELVVFGLPDDFVRDGAAHGPSPALVDALLHRVVNEIANVTMVAQPALLAIEELAQSEPKIADHSAVLDAVCGRLVRYVRDVNALLASDSTVDPTQPLSVLEEYIDVEFVRQPPNIRFVSQLCTDLWSVSISANEIKRICGNLVRNAVMATRRGGTVKLEASNVQVTENNPIDLPAGDYLRIRVTDDGIGMPLDTLARATEPFFTTWSSHEHWSGLGLTEVETLCRRSGGRLSLRSTPERGTMASAFLPRAPMPAAGAPRSDDGLQPSSPLHILVVDDEPLVLAAMHRGLRQLGHEVHLAQDIPTALAILQEGSPCSVAVIDVNLGNTSGIALARVIADQFPSIRLVLTTGAMPPGANANEGVELDPVIPILRKPFDPGALLSVLSSQRVQTSG